MKEEIPAARVFNFILWKGCHATHISWMGALDVLVPLLMMCGVKYGTSYSLYYIVLYYIGEGTGGPTNGDWLYRVMRILASQRRSLHWNGCRHCALGKVFLEMEIERGGGGS